jgi:hypothetical protein
MTIVEIADRSIEINRNLRVALYEILALAEGLSKVDRERLAPKIKAALEASADMPTGDDVNSAFPADMCDDLTTEQCQDNPR